MEKKVVWVILSGVMVSALLLASCAPAVTEEEEVAPAPAKEEKKEVVTEEEVAPPPKGPQYGGVLNYAISSSAYGFDEAYIIPPLVLPIQLTHQCLYIGDWAKGPAGTGEVTWQLPIFVEFAEIPCLCESWEMPDEESVVFHIRKGVHWHDKPPVNGRELTADDVAFTFEHIGLSDLPLSWKSIYPGQNIESVEATDRYTVVVKCTPGFLWYRMVDMVECTKIYPPEAGGEYPGDFRDWETCIGTGPFMLEDEVKGSSLTFVRNPNFWMNDPLHPENSVPYVDRVNWLVIPDRSTRLAALRTGKIAALGDLIWEDRDNLIKTSPELQWVPGGTGQANLVGMRIDKPELPFDDIRVRQALAMGVNRQAIVEDYYAGNAELFSWPIVPSPEFKDMFRPLDEFPESVQEQFEYNPGKARQLLAEAGYPDGFQTEIICTQSDADLLSVFKDDWAKIGVDLELDVKDMGVYRSIVRRHTHKQMMFRRPCGGPYKMREFRLGLEANTSMVDDPHLLEIYSTDMAKTCWDWDTVSRALKEKVVPYALEQCWYIAAPAPSRYTFWQPWLKGYHGEAFCGNLNTSVWQQYVWIDQELKEEMGH